MTNDQEVNNRLAQTLWRIYNRPERPELWDQGGNLPWNDPDFSERMLREHLDESHGAASRQAKERMAQIEWVWSKLELSPGARVLDVTCGPGLYAIELARRGCDVTGIDFSPASIAYARDLAICEGVATRCTFVEQDVHTIDFAGAAFDAALFLYGQLAVFKKEEAQALLEQVALALKPGGNLAGDTLDLSDGKVQLGDLVFVELELSNISGITTQNIALVDRLPAGFEVENSRLGRSFKADWIDPEADWAVDYFNLRDDRLEAFGSLAGNTSKKIIYTVRAVTSGKYATPPVEAEAMYDPTLWAREKGTTAVVGGPWTGRLL
jgi:SAM-dependent methyltransferase